MSFGYAGETLELLDENHFQSRLHRDREALSALARDNPADVVRLVLASHGPLAVVALRETLVPDLLADAEWDAFWDAARKGLKASGAVTIPARRSEPLRLADAERQSFDAPWFARLSAERSREAILAAAAELAAAGRRFEAGSPETAVLADRIAHACRGAESRAPHIVAQLLVAAGRLGIPAERHDAAALLATLLAPATLAVCLTRLPARAVGEWLAYAAGAAPDALSAALLAALHDLPAGVMADVMKAVAAMGAEERLAGGLRTEIHRVRPGAGILLWLLKNPAWVRGRQLTDEATLFNLGIECLEAPGGGETLKAQKAMRELYTDEVWLRAAMEPMTRLQRENAVRRLSTSPGWDPASRRSVLARVLRAFPDLSAVLVPEGGRAAGGAAAAPANRFTSWRMLTARQAQLRRLVEVDLPANSRDIAVARSYGDLRENFEYQAAKDQQRLLLRRKDELEADLAAMKGTDFEGAPVDRVGPGVEVRVRRASGAESVFRVLGEWDSDAALGIVASGSLVGQRLAGRQVGDTVRLPADNGEEECRIEGVGPLPAEVQDWTRAGEARNAGAERTVADGAAQ
jgi:transcription elongation GreA/GreB family factor